MTAVRRLLGRREFLVRLGKGAVGLAVLGIAACSDDSVATTTSAPGTTSGDAAPSTSGATTSAPPTTSAATTEASATTAGMASRIQRVNLGFVSAYIVARDEGAAVVDTGTPGSAADIEAGLGTLGLGWGDVGHVILTHRHGDHIGSLAGVMASAAAAAAYAGEADIPAIDSPRPVTAVGDGDFVFGLEVVATPGHTPGHISVIDPIASALIAGDAINGSGSGGEVLGPNPDFTPDMATAIASAVKLGGFEYDDAFFGHGEPVTGGASAAVAALAATLEA